MEPANGWKLNVKITTAGVVIIPARSGQTCFAGSIRVRPDRIIPVRARNNSESGTSGAQKTCGHGTSSHWQWKRSSNLGRPSCFHVRSLIHIGRAGLFGHEGSNTLDPMNIAIITPHSYQPIHPYSYAEFCALSASALVDRTTEAGKKWR